MPEQRNELNLSQRSIAMSERTFSGSAVNTISATVYIPEFDAQKVKCAVDSVLGSADVFSARLVEEQNEFYFLLNSAALYPCTVLKPSTYENVKQYIMRNDSLPLGFPDRLYQAEVIPLIEGGCVLYVRFHHIITDGFGMSLFTERVLNVLEGKPICTSSFFEDKHTDASQEEKALDESFWREYFSDADFDASVFPSAPAGLNKSVYSRALSAELSKKIADYAASEGVTAPYVLAAAYALYLAESTGKSDAVILMPRLNRTEGQMNTIGCYTLLVPVRVRVVQNEAFSDLCKRVAESAKAASAHKTFGYDNILRVLREEDNISETPSEYVFNFYRYDYDTSVKFDYSFSVAGAMHNHLTWSIFKKGDILSFDFDLRDGVYDLQRAEFIFDAIRAVLCDGCGQKQVKDIEVIGKFEKKNLLGIKGKEIPFSSEETILSLFADAVNKFAQCPALYAGEEELNFKELDELSDKIAYALIDKGVRSGQSVAFMLKRDIRLIPTMLGILKTGAAFIPVDPMYPADRVEYILEDSGASYLISSAEAREEQQNIKKANFLDIDELINDDCARVELPQISQSQRAYMIYTSGTTGRPKGVMLSHRGIVNIVNPDNNPFNRDAAKNGKGITAIGSICFDISLFEIFVPLLNGLFVELGNEKAMIDAGELAAHIERHGADMLHCTPSRLVSYLSNTDFARALKNVKMVLSAGEVLPQTLISELRDRFGIRVYNGYGPTETTIGATITQAGDDKSIGAPIANMGILLLNANGKLVPYGAVGEICIFGVGIGMGYNGREEETRAKFTEWNGIQIYHTGDLGHLTDDGRLIYHGRNDRQVKLRGLRIELSEIEKVMGAYEGVLQTCCMIRKINKSDHIVGFFTTDKHSVVDTAQLRSFMKQRLTAYMVPDVLKELENMPQTPGGKTDMKALAKEPVELVRVYKSPKNHTEEIICSAFEAILSSEKIGADDNFFELGGDSLSTMELMLDIEQRLELEKGKLDYSDIYKYPTPALLAEKIGTDKEADNGYDLEKLDYTGIEQFLAEHSHSDAKKHNLGNVLLTGATGYLGIHILMELLKNPDMCGKVYCLVRSNGRLSAEKRVKSALFYYDEPDMALSYGDKWFAIEGDIAAPLIFKDELTDHIDTIINSAANVAHFAYGNALEQVNTGGVKNLIDFALRQKAAICQISTISVGGLYEKTTPKECFTEKDFYVGQQIHNQYIYSKYMAEYELLRAALKDKLPVKIMRVGNLQGRSLDGEFQMNMKSNAFTRQLSAYVKLKAVPHSVYNARVNFSPVDETAHMIVSLAGTDEGQVLFHVYPPKEAPFEKIFEGLSSLGHNVRIIEDAEFEELLQSAKQTPEGKSAAEGLLIERPDGRFKDIPITQEITDSLLGRLGEAWLPVTEEYLHRYLSSLDDLDMF